MCPVNHAYFDLLILSDDELGASLNSRVVSRQLLREWPLSVVEAITTADGLPWICKSVREPLTIEGEFYQSNHSLFLPEGRTVYSTSPCQVLVYPMIQGVHPSELNLNNSEVLAMLARLLDLISSLESKNLPCRIDISTPSRFCQRFAATAQKIIKLIHDRKFLVCSEELVDLLKRIADNELLAEQLTSQAGYRHGDLAADNVIIDPAGSLYIIDWQRMVYGSPLLDQYLFLESMGIGYSGQLPLEAAILAYIERIDWYVDCALFWYPSAAQRYDTFVHELADQLAPIYQNYRKKMVSK